MGKGIERGVEMFGLGMQELIIIFVIVMVLFGARRLPEIGKGLGQAIRNFKKATDPEVVESNTSRILEGKDNTR